MFKISKITSNLIKINKINKLLINNNYKNPIIRTFSLNINDNKKKNEKNLQEHDEHHDKHHHHHHHGLFHSHDNISENVEKMNKLLYSEQKLGKKVTFTAMGLNIVLGIVKVFIYLIKLVSCSCLFTFTSFNV